MHPLFLLAFVTFVILVGFLVWNRISTARHTAGRRGPGGLKDPLAGATEEMRHPDEMRASLDAADNPTVRNQQAARPQEGAR